MRINLKIIGNRSLSVINLGAAACAATAATDLATTGGCGLAIFAASGSLINAVHEEHRKEFEKYLKKAQKTTEEEIAKNAFITGEATQADIDEVYEALMPAIESINPRVKDFADWGLNPANVADALVDLFVKEKIAPFYENEACKQIARVVIHAAFSALKTDQKFWQRGDIWIREALFEKLEKIDKGLEFIRTDIANLSDKIDAHLSIARNAQLKIIDRAFLERTLVTGDSAHFTASNFYLGKRSEDYQWYGILKKWDVPREIYEEFKKKTLSSFKEKSRNNIAAVISGVGGSGKSTLLRRLAIDCVDADFTVLWIDDTNIVEFFEGRHFLNLSKDVSFLFILEDWYRIKQHLDDTQSLLLLTALNNLKNSRICLGDRLLDHHVISMLQGGEKLSHFKLLSDQTLTVIKGVLKNLPTVKSKIVGHLADLKTGSVYTTIYALSRLELSGEFSEIELGEIDTHFIEIITSDLKKLASFHLGVARLLVFWAKIYKNRKFGISPKIISQLWSLLDPENRRHLSEQAQVILNLYISQETGVEGFFLFNQDTLAEMGLSQPIFSARLEEQNFTFDQNIKLEIIETLLDISDQSVTKILQALILDIGFDNFVFEELYNLSITSQTNGIYGWHTTAFLSHKDCPKAKAGILQTVEELFEGFLQAKYFLPSIALLNILKYIRGTEGHKRIVLKILKHENLLSMPHEIITEAFKQKGNESAKKSAALKVLVYEDITSIPHLGMAAFKQKGNEKAKRLVAQKILEYEDITSLPQLGVAAFKQKGNYEKKEALAHKILQNVQSKHVNEIAEPLIIESFRYGVDQSIKYQAASNILQSLESEDVKQWPGNLAAVAFRNLNTNEVENPAVLKVLQYEDITSLNNFMVTNAFRQEVNAIVKDNAFEQLIDKWGLEKIPTQWYSMVLIYFNSRALNDTIGNQFVSYINDVIETFINNKRNRVVSEHRVYAIYTMVLSFPFTQIGSWKKTTDFILKNWKKQNRNHVAQILTAYKNYPLKSFDACQEILANWETECKKEHYMLNSKIKRVGGCLRLALKHPHLSEQAKIVAHEMIDSHNAHNAIPDEFITIAHKILINEV